MKGKPEDKQDLFRKQPGFEHVKLTINTLKSVKFNNCNHLLIKHIL